MKQWQIQLSTTIIIAVGPIFSTNAIQKREAILGGVSVWYANDVDIEIELRSVFRDINLIRWASLSKQDFIKKLARLFPRIWQIHPFREGNTRTTVMLLTFFVERYGYYFDQELFAASAGYVRNAFVLASIGKHSESVHICICYL